MKKMFFIFCTVLTVLLASCGSTPHEHTFEEQWSKNETSHWHAASCEHTELTKDLASHTYGSDGKCTVCGKAAPVPAHVHTFSTTYSFDETNHWRTATCEHKEQTKDLGEHTYGVDNKCTVCGMEKPIPPHEHTFSSDWANDETNHWKECSCGVKSEINIHTYDEGVIVTYPSETSTGLKRYTCKVCNQIKTEVIPKITHAHSALPTYYFDDDTHYQLCSCGVKMNSASHNYDNGVITKYPTSSTPGEKTFTCKTCGKRKIEAINPTGKDYGSFDKPISVSDAIKIANEDIKYNDEYTKKEIYCFGEVKSVGSKKSYGYQNVVVKDGSNSILIYTITVDSSFSINVGDTIYFHGYIKMYDGVLEFATYTDETSTYYVTLYDGKQESKDLCFSINSSNFDYSASYDSNYDSIDIYSNNLKATFTVYNFDTYYGSSFIKLLGVQTYNNVDTIGGYIGNLTCFNNIKKIDISYSSNKKAFFTYGNDYECLTKLEMPASGGSIKQFSVDATSSFTYYKIMADESDVYISSIDIYFGGLGSTLSKRDKISSLDKFDLSSYVINNPSEGQKVSVPYTFDSLGNVLSNKTFTYYSFSYVKNHKSSINISSITYTDPRDISTYYTIFNRIPCNFASKNAQSYDPDEFLACGSVNDVKNIFGNDTRYVSKYDLTSGYMKSIPYNTYSGNKPLYYEFDIKLDSYSTSSRGSGRVVGVARGLSCYDNYNNVCFYTDDHYTTFMEYLNNGNFSSRFDTGDKNVFATGKSYNPQVLV